MKHITTDELRRMTDAEGLILQGCGGDPEEWISGVNEMLTKEGILLEGDTFRDIYVFEHDGLTNMLFGMDDVRLDIGKLAVWRLASHDTFGGTWLSDYIPNRLGRETEITPEPKTPSIQVYIENADKPELGGATIPLPASAEEIQPFLKGLEIYSQRDAGVYEAEFAVPVPGLAEAEAGELNLDELNYLAAKLDGLGGAEERIFAAAVEAGRHCGSAAELINLTENLGSFDLQPAYGAEHYGEFLLETEKDNTSAVFDRLEHSVDPHERELAAYILRLEAHVDEAAYGRAVAEEENGAFTQQGYLNERDGGFKEVYRSPEDIPARYRVAYPQPDPLLKVENADLNALLLKMHALSGDYMHDARYNLNALADGVAGRHSTEYLLLMSERGMFLADAHQAYRRGTTAFDAFMNTPESTNTRAYAIHVTDVHNGPPRGDVVEVAFEKQQLDILKHSIHCTRIDATPKYGPDQSFTPEQWEAMEPIDRHMLASWTRQFDVDDTRAVAAHLGDIREGHAVTGKAVEEAVLLSDINRGYMEKAENGRPDMLRVTLPAAKELLTHGDALVYRLMPEGPKRLEPLDAMPSRDGLWYKHYREFAVKKDDLAGIGKWADRESAALVRRSPERDAPEKPKQHGPEL